MTATLLIVLNILTELLKNNIERFIKTSAFTLNEMEAAVGLCAEKQDVLS